MLRKTLFFSDFGGASLYVVGTGIITGKNSTTYRDPKILMSLKNFWEEYFSKSNANLVELGQPALKNDKNKIKKENKMGYVKNNLPAKRGNSI